MTLIVDGIVEALCIGEKICTIRNCNRISQAFLYWHTANLLVTCTSVQNVSSLESWEFKYRRFDKLCSQRPKSFHFYSGKVIQRLGLMFKGLTVDLHDY